MASKIVQVVTVDKTELLALDSDGELWRGTKKGDGTYGWVCIGGLPEPERKPLNLDAIGGLPPQLTTEQWERMAEEKYPVLDVDGDGERK